MISPCLNCSDKPWWCRDLCSERMKYKASKEKEKAARYAETNKNGISIDSYARHKKRNRNPNRAFKTHMR